jgi:carbamoyltransferase
MTRFVGVKFTHDAAVAMIDATGKLQWSLELEKFGNNPRYTEAESLSAVRKALDSEGFEFHNSDVLCIDGWRAGKLFRPIELDVAGYWPDIEFQFVTLSNFARETLRLDLGTVVGSTPHITGHVLGAYLMSPYAGERCDVLMWDGGTRPMLYQVDPQKGITGGKALFNLYGTLYGIMGYYAGPFKTAGMERLRHGDYTKSISRRDWPGKLMSWIGHGKVSDAVLQACENAHHILSDGRRPEVYPDKRVESAFNDCRPENAFMQLVLYATAEESITDADLLRSIHQWMGDKIVEGLEKHGKTMNLVFVGGSALNIKWNSQIRRMDIDVWVPPCPNDSGSAIGAAAAARWAAGEKTALDWDVYCGPRMSPAQLVVDQMPYSAHPKFTKTPMQPHELGRWLWEHPDDYVCVLHGRAEIGPRALGHRSLLMAATESPNKNTLNMDKNREHWRPVAPIVLEEDAPALFHPGTPDPYMLFDHVIRPECAGKFPAITHIDNTARIQTVGFSDCAIVRSILQGYAAASGGPGLLCNTSANKNGSGFFPDLASADEWGADHIWDGAVLWTRHSKRIRR